MTFFRTLAIAATLVANTAAAGPVSFSSGWSEQKLSLFSNNRYSFGNTLSMTSDGGVSIAWKRIPQSDWQSTNGRWNWTVEQSVPATDLRQKGGDDRNMSLYFVFVPDDQAAGLQNASIRQLLGNDDVRVLLYVWGGNHARGSQFQSPYLRGQGVNVMLRQAGTGSYSENVNLAADYAQAFGGQPGSLVGIAVSGDSDDTDSTIRAAIGNLTLN
ncbi:DUF3047 domain-containing protein [Loktanella sp. F6476L]|uniref:DUF3047 domain-containing protein n=1 Tax=Loktanella sp. F6476L TaxID=2926405 RepID=UPI001FF6FA83|nr:DUF3047 domain-containing protein [Loktanella sp. F6476L]MCK0119103.1 DUF3047 domain-containing protein [Loktanella sp. F6476L]